MKKKEKTPKDATQKKPIYKRKWFIAVVILVLLCIIGGAAGGEKQPANTDSAKQSKEQTTETTKSQKEIEKEEKEKAEAEEKAEKEKEKELKKRLKHADEEIEALKNKTCYKAETILNELGYKGTYTFETNGLDFTEDIKAMDDSQLKSFTITAVNDVNKSKKTAEFTINSKTNIEKGKKESKLRKKLSEGSSCVAIQTYGETQYPYGFDFSSFSATFTLKDDNSWHVAGSCEVTNQYGAEAELQCIAEVTGTSENPTVTYFEVR